MEKDVIVTEVGHENPGFLQVSFRGDAQINERTGDRSQVERSQSSATTSGKNNPSHDNEADDKVDLSCGIWRFRTNIFGRKFSNLYVFITCVGLSTFFTTVIHTTFQIQLTSMQRQFGINNLQTGMFETASRIGSLSTILFAGHFAKKAHIPVVVGLAGLIQGIIFMVPAFIQILDPYTLPIISYKDTSSNGTNSTNENDKYLCSAVAGNGTGINDTVLSDTTADNTNTIAFHVLVIIQAVKGITDAFHAGFLPILYVDDNALDKTKMGLIFGIQTIISSIAHPIGKQINAFMSKVPIDLKDTLLDPHDERFVAAWWLPFLIFGGLTVLVSFPILLFPRKLVSQRQQVEALRKATARFGNGGEGGEDDNTGTEDTKDTEVKTENPKLSRASTKRDNLSTIERKYSKRSLAPRNSNPIGFVDTTNYGNSRRSSLLPPVQGPSERRISMDGRMIFEQPVKERTSVVGADSIQGSSSVKELLKDFPKAVYRVFRRPVFSLFIFDVFVASIPMAGLTMFRTVYVTNEYNVSMADAATLTAATQVGGQLFGIVISGYLAKKVTSKTGFVYILIGTHLLSLIVTPAYLLLGCDNQPIYGHEGDFGRPVNTTDICGCSGTENLLSCGDDGNLFLSPCYAGCKRVHGNQPNAANSCTKVTPTKEALVFTECSGLGEVNSTMNVVTGLCPTDCRTNFLIYIVLHAVHAVSWSMSSIPGQLLTLRMVDPRDRGFASSIFTFCSTIASIPAPNIFGRIIDGTCLLWKGNSCSLYDRDKIRYLLSGADIASSALIQFTILLTVYFFKKEEREDNAKLQEERRKKEEPVITTQL